jgi:hypothetical protein
MEMLLSKSRDQRVQALELCMSLPQARWLAKAPEDSHINPQAVRGFSLWMLERGLAANKEIAQDLLGNLIDLEIEMEHLYHFYHEDQSYRVRGGADNSGVYATRRVNMRAWFLERQGVMGMWTEVAKTYLPNTAGVEEARRQLGVGSD